MTLGSSGLLWSDFRYVTSDSSIMLISSNIQPMRERSPSWSLWHRLQPDSGKKTSCLNLLETAAQTPSSTDFTTSIQPGCCPGEFIFRSQRPPKDLHRNWFNAFKLWTRSRVREETLNGSTETEQMTQRSGLRMEFMVQMFIFRWKSFISLRWKETGEFRQ